MINSLNVDLDLYILMLYILPLDGPKMDIEFELRIFIVFNRSGITQQHQQHILTYVFFYPTWYTILLK